MNVGDPDDLPVEVTTDYGHFAIVPEILINSRVSDAAVRLYAVLALHADRKSSTTFVGYRAIGDLLGKSKRSLMRACAELVEAGAIAVTPRTVGGRRTSNLYRLLVMTPPGDKNVTTVGDRNGTAVTRTRGTRKQASSVELDGAKRIAAAIHDRDNLINFAAVMKLAEKALMAGEPARRVEMALHAIIDAGRPITGETLRLQIGRMKRPVARDSPWEVQ